MKSVALTLSLAAGLLATTAVAQTAAPQTPQNPAAAATLPNTFEARGNATQADAPVRTSPPATAATSAPDIARAETSLREVITAIKAGQVDYSVFSDDLAAKIREQSNQMGSLLTQFGDIQSIRHLGQPDGTDMFRVEFTNQATEWVIGFDNEDQIAALLFRPAD